MESDDPFESGLSAEEPEDAETVWGIMRKGWLRGKLTDADWEMASDTAPNLAYYVRSWGARMSAMGRAAEGNRLSRLAGGWSRDGLSDKEVLGFLLAELQP